MALTEDQVVTFRGIDTKGSPFILKYEVSDNHLTGTGCNDAIFEALGLNEPQAEDFCSKYYGYKSGVGAWPSCRRYDYEALERVVIALTALCDQTIANHIKMDKIRTITPSQAQQIIDCACVEWKNKLFDQWGVSIVFKTPIKIQEEFYNQMRKACTPDQHKLFDEIFSSDIKDIDLTDASTIDGRALFDLKGNNALIQKRNTGILRDKAFYLNSNFDWSIVKDDCDEFCLVPKHKEQS